LQIFGTKFGKGGQVGTGEKNLGVTRADEQSGHQFISLKFIECMAHFIEEELVNHIGSPIGPFQSPGDSPVAMVGDLYPLVVHGKFS
jgi:hypothetical protein